MLTISSSTQSAQKLEAGHRAGDSRRQAVPRCGSAIRKCSTRHQQAKCGQLESARLGRPGGRPRRPSGRKQMGLYDTGSQAWMSFCIGLLGTEPYQQFRNFNVYGVAWKESILNYENNHYFKFKLLCSGAMGYAHHRSIYYTNK